MGGNSSAVSFDNGTKSLTVSATGRVERPSNTLRTSGLSVISGRSRDSARSSRAGSGSRSGTGMNTSGSPTTEILQDREDHENSRALAIQSTRSLLGISMIVVAAALGAGVFFFFRDQENKLAMSQFRSIAMRASHYAQHATQMKRSGTITMATMIGVAYPYASQFPFVLIDGWDAISNSMVETIHSDSIGYSPLVTPEDLDAFEDFAYDAYQNTLMYPNETFTKDFGRGVWAQDILTDEQFLEDRTGATYWRSPNKIFAPILLHTDGEDADSLLTNLHHGKIFGETIDSILACSQSRTDTTTECGELSDLMLRWVPKNSHSHMDHGNGHMNHDHGSMDHSSMDHGTMDHGTMDHSSMDHGSMDHSTMDHGAMDHDHASMDHTGHRKLTDVMNSADQLHSMMGMESHQDMMNMSPQEHAEYMQKLMDQQLKQEEEMIKAPSSLIMQPIYPANDPDKVVGIISSHFVWQESLNSAFPDSVSGVRCVLKSSTGSTYTYSVTKGVVSLMGLGDFHDGKFDKYVVPIDLINEASGLYSAYSKAFDLYIFPTEEFIQEYHTRNPLIGTIVIVSVMVFLTLIFCLYDWYVKREFTFKNELLEAKRNFIRFVSHEVRTPLNAVCMGLMLVREEIDNAIDGIKEEDTKEDCECETLLSKDGLSAWKGTTDEILENTQNAVGVLNDLLNYDKITSGTLKLELSLLNIDNLMNHAQKEFKLPAAKKSISVEFDDRLSAPYRRSAMTIVGDDVRLTQVLRNLMSNALKFTPKGGKVKVTVSWAQELPDEARKKGKHKSIPEPVQEQEFTLKNGEQVQFAPSGYLQLGVSDTGAGMTEDQMSNVFDRGTQFNVNELQCGQGSGLGLYIAKGIMDQHLGSLTVRSDGLHRGTTFTMCIPLYRDPNSSRDESRTDSESDHFTFKASKAKVRSSKEDISNLRLLVVDDSPTNLKFLCRILKKRGHECDQAADGDIAVDMVAKSMVSDDGDLENSLRSRPYDAVLLDYEMPRMNGPTAASKMRAMGSDTFIVGITGNLLPEDVNYFRDQGANEVLPKPFNMSDLEELLMEYGVGFRA